jgi:hypothetical protein
MYKVLFHRRRNSYFISFRQLMGSNLVCSTLGFHSHK